MWLLTWYWSAENNSLFWVHCTLFGSFCCSFNGPDNNNHDWVIHPFLKSQNTYVPSSELEPPTPFTSKWVCPTRNRRGDSLACGWGGGGPNSDDWKKKPSTLLRYFTAPYWGTFTLYTTSVSCAATFWATLHPTELRWTLLRHTAPHGALLHSSELRCTLLSYAAPYWATIHIAELLCRWFRFAQLAKGKKSRP